MTNGLMTYIIRNVMAHKNNDSSFPLSSQTVTVAVPRSPVSIRTTPVDEELSRMHTLEARHDAERGFTERRDKFP